MILQPAKLFFLNEYEHGLLSQIDRDRLWTASARFTVPANTTTYLRAVVPEGYRLRVVYREVLPAGGDWLVDLLTAGGDPGTPMVFSNLGDYEEKPPVCRIEYNATLASGEVEEVKEHGTIEGTTELPTNRTGGVPSTSSYYRSLRSNRLLKIHNMNASDYRVTANIIYFEDKI